MTKNTKNPAVPEKLSDAELAEIVGGASWSASMEAQFSQLFERLKASGKTTAQTIDEYLKSYSGKAGATGVELRSARNAWLADGSPSDMRYEVDSNGVLNIKPI